MAQIVHHSFVALLLIGCAVAEKVTYDDQVLPIFERSCLNCHNPDKAKGGLDLSSYAGTLKGGSGGKIVEPGNTSSKLIGVVRHSVEPAMPPEGDAIPAAEIKTLDRWISGGLLENLDSKAKKPSKPKFNPVLTLDTAKPDGPAPLPRDLLLDPAVVAPRSTAIHAMALSPTAPVLAITGQNQVLLYHSTSLQLLGVLPFPEGEPVSTSFTPSGRHLIVGGGIGGKSGVTVSFDVTTGERILVAAKEFDSILTADLHPDISQVVTGSPSKLIKLWRSEDGSQFASIKKHTDWVTSVDFSNDGILLASGDRNGGAWVWEAATGNEFHTLRGHQSGITEARFRSDSNLLATASHDGSVRMWEMNGGKEVKKIDAHGGGVLAFAWGHDGRFLTAGRDRTAKLWKADFNAAITIKNLKDIPTAIALDTERGRAFIADYQGHIAVYELKEGKPVGTINANPPSIATRLGILRKAAETSQQQLLTSKDAHQKKQSAVQASEQKLAAIRSNLKQANTQRDKAKPQIAATEAAIRPLEAQIKSVASQETEASANLTTQRAPLEPQLRSLNQSKEKVTQLTAETKAITLALEKAHTETDEAKRKAAVAQEEARLKAAEQGLASALQSHSKAEKELQGINEAISQASGHLNRLQQQRAKTQGELDAYNQKLAQQKKLHGEASLKASRFEDQAQMVTKELAKDRDALDKLAADLKSRQDEVDSKTKQLAFWNRARLRSLIHTNRSALAITEQQTEQLKNRFSETTEEMSAFEIKSAEKRGQLQQLQAEINKEPDPEVLARLKPLAASTRSEVSKLEDKVESVRLRMIADRKSLDDAFQKIHQLRYQLEADEARHAAGGKQGN